MQKIAVTSVYEKQIKAGRLSRGMNFNEKVWALTSRVPKGKVTTYGEIARKLGTKAYRAVGGALNRNPFAPQVPCHRVVGSTGSLTGFATGIPKKARLLKAEGVTVQKQKVMLSEHFQKL
jgi:methylated-DNA-[protein]-cysteine S-methyltransferase